MNTPIYRDPDIEDESDIRVVWVKLDEITPSSWNPPSRTTYQALKDLEDDIKARGKVLVPLALTRDGRIADGHRRYACAKRVGLTRIPCIYYDTLDAQQLWSDLNRNTRPVMSTTWVEAYGAGLLLEKIPPKPRSQLIGLQRILKKEEFSIFIAKKRSPGILQTAYWIANICRDPSDAFVRAIILWIMHYEQLNILRHVIHEGMTSDQIIDVILNDRKLTRRWI